MKDEEKKEKNKSLEEEIKEESSQNKEEISEESEDVVEFEFNDDPEGNSSDSYGAGGEDDLVKKIKKLKLELANCRKEKQEYLTGWQKERADFLNYKKQEEDRKMNFSENVKEQVFSRFFSVIDSFDMAFANKEAWEKVNLNWRKGVEYIYGQINAIFEEYGVKSLGEVGEVFDPNIHQSVEMIETDKKEDDHKVASVIQKGYKLGERVMRPARVNVYAYRDKEE
jgi:molecular chaperone GrpE